MGGPPVAAAREAVPDAVIDAIRAVTGGRAEVRAVYLFARPDLAAELYAGVELVPGVKASAVLPSIGAELRDRLPPDYPLRLLALSRRMLGLVQSRVAPL